MLLYHSCTFHLKRILCLESLKHSAVRRVFQLFITECLLRVAHLNVFPIPLMFSFDLHSMRTSAFFDKDRQCQT